MNFSKTKFWIVMAGAAVLSASANAQVLQVGGVGSSAMFQTATIEAYGLATGRCNCVPGYFTAKNAAAILDQRNDANIVNQVGNLSVVWDNAQNPQNVWYYLSVDSVVGNRAYFSVPRAWLGAINNVPAAGVINAAYFGGTAPQAIPAAVLAVINNKPFTAAFTDIRPEDALFAELRTNCGTAATAALGCLGYGTADANAGAQIKSGVAGSTAQAQPVAFNIFGNDPVTGQAIPQFETVPVGVSPVTFIVNRQDQNGLGAGAPNYTFTGMNFQASPVLLFGGFNCDTSAFGINGAPLAAVYPVLREPISGTMNTFEYNVMLPYWSQFSKQNFWFSQEGYLYPPYVMPGPGQNNLGSWAAISPAANNPLNGACPATGVNNGWAGGPQGNRVRAIGTGEVVTEVKNTQDAIGYIFFSYGNVSSISNNASYGYLTYGEWPGGQGGSNIPTDPINPSGVYGTPYVNGNINFPGNGKLPVCTAPCPLPPNVSFPNVRNGAYQQWSLLRAVADQGTASYNNLVTLASGIADQVNLTSPDFIPYSPAADGDNGLQFYRSHFKPVGVNFNATNTPNDGLAYPSGAYVPGTEAGGDVGGCIDWRYPPNNAGDQDALIGCRY